MLKPFHFWGPGSLSQSESSFPRSNTTIGRAKSGPRWGTLLVDQRAMRNFVKCFGKVKIYDGNGVALVHKLCEDLKLLQQIGQAGLGLYSTKCEVVKFELEPKHHAMRLSLSLRPSQSPLLLCQPWTYLGWLPCSFVTHIRFCCTSFTLPASPNSFYTFLQWWGIPLPTL